MISQAELRGMMVYNPDTGIFTWTAPKSRKMKYGDMAGSVKPDGRIHIKIDGMVYKASSLAVLYMTGVLPTKLVKHLNNKREDNTWANLGKEDVEVLPSNVVAINPPVVADRLRTTEFADIHKVGNNFRPEAIVNNKVHYLPLFNTPELAKAALDEFNRKCH